jgi:hypothetical protein
MVMTDKRFIAISSQVDDDSPLFAMQRMGHPVLIRQEA